MIGPESHEPDVPMQEENNKVPMGGRFSNLGRYLLQFSFFPTCSCWERVCESASASPAAESKPKSKFSAALN